MANLFGLAGAQPQKQTKYAPIYNPRWTSGIWTNRSPLRDATTTRIVEKFYGAAGDALIAGLNVEISNKLTLIRRPGNSQFDTNTYNSVDRFYDFHLFGPTTEQIEVMIDEADGLYALYAPQNPAKHLIWAKGAGTGQTYMQSVGNTLFFGDGVDNKKYLQTLFKWTANTVLNTATTPFLTTFLIDPNGNIQQLTGTAIGVASVDVNADQVEVFTTTDISKVLAPGDNITFPSTGMVNSFLEGQTVTITQVGITEFIFSFIAPNQANTAENPGIYAAVEPGDGSPRTGASQPIWSLTVPSSINLFQGGTTIDGSVVWINRGNPVENWGLANATTPLTPAVQGGFTSWAINTFFSLVSCVIDPNGNLQQVSTPGLSGATPPLWSPILGGKTFDGAFPSGSPSTGVVWTMIASAAMLNWQANQNYPVGSFLVNQVNGASVSPGTLAISAVAVTSGGAAVYTVSGGGSSDAWFGYKFVVAGMSNPLNNGTYYCIGSSSTTLVLNNPYAVAETHAGTAISPNTSPLCLFQSGPPSGPYISGPITAYAWAAPHSGGVGTWDGVDPYNAANPSSSPSGLPYGQTTTGSANAGQASNLSSFDFAVTPGGGGSFVWNTVNSSGQVTGTTNPFPGQNQNLYLSINGTLEFSTPGNYTFVVSHGDGLVWGIGGTATFVSGTAPSNLAVAGVNTSLNGYPILPAGNNLNVTANSGNQFVDTYVINIPAAGTYPVEFLWSRWDKNNAGMSVTVNGVTLPFGQPSGGGGTSGPTVPVWPAWTTADAPNYASVTEGSGRLTWNNIGFISDFVWAPAENFTAPDSQIVDSNGNNEAPFRTGYTAATGGAPAWATNLDGLTNDNPNLIWINLGPNLNPPKGALSTSNGGWVYAISLVNTLDDTVSNATKISAPTGNHEDFTGVVFTPGEGLPPVSQIDPQADYVAIWRSTDGQDTPFLIPMANIDYSAPITISLHDYLTNGYTDTTPDVDLNNLISAPILGENTPPAAGASNLAFYLNRIFYSVGATVYWTTGPATPAGNGLNGTSPLNFDEQASLVNRIVPTTSGSFIFTVSDINLIQSTGNTASPISQAIPLLQGIGLLSYNALDVCGAQIGFFSTDHQFLILDPSSGVSSAGYPLGDQFRLNNGKTAQSWNPANVYVAWHVNGEDQAWYVADGSQGWFRMMSTPAPETGSYTWSPFAKIVSGVKALQSIEVTPGNHQLLLGPVGAGLILQRDLDTNQDGGVSYPANAVMGSCVLAQPGQIAVVPFITVEQVGIGTPIVLGVLIDEALPYYTGPFNILKLWENDPPNLKPSISLPSQRFYLADDSDYAAAMRHMQIQINWAAENFPSELATVTIFGGYLQES